MFSNKVGYSVLKKKSKSLVFYLLTLFQQNSGRKHKSAGIFLKTEMMHHIKLASAKSSSKVH